MEHYLHTDKQDQERPIQWKVTTISKKAKIIIKFLALKQILRTILK